MKAFEKDGGNEEQEAKNRASGFEKLKAEYSIQATPIKAYRKKYLKITALPGRRDAGRLRLR